jgi:GntR family transcriptional repressor for pyruvate dehydrogenase complex
VTPVSRPDSSLKDFAAPADPPPFGGPKLERQPISEQVANRILGMVKSGNLRPGDRLPTEAQMAIALGISRPPLREALKALTIMGVLESRQGGRYSVTDLSPSRLVAPFNAMLSVAAYDIAEHFECRRIVDVELARLCTRRATSEERARILRLAHDGQAFLSDPVGFRLLDYEFHQALNAGARNAMLATVALGLYDVALDARRVASAALGVIPTSVRQHVEVAEAVVAGDEEAAAAALNRHLDHVLDSTLQSLAEMAASTSD